MKKTILKIMPIVLLGFVACKKEEPSLLKDSLKVSSGSALSEEYQLPENSAGWDVITAFQADVEAYNLDISHSGDDMSPKKALILMEALINHTHANFMSVSDDTRYYAHTDQIDFSIPVSGSELASSDILSKYAWLEENISVFPDDDGFILIIADIEYLGVVNGYAEYVVHRNYGKELGTRADAGAQTINSGYCSYSTNPGPAWAVITGLMNQGNVVTAVHYISEVGRVTTEWDGVSTPGDIWKGNSPNICIIPDMFFLDNAKTYRDNMISTFSPPIYSMFSNVYYRNGTHGLGTGEWAHYVQVVHAKVNTQ